MPAPARRPVRDVIFDDAFPPGATERNTSRNAADWVADPPFGAQSGRRVLRQANGAYYEDVLQLAARPVVVPAGGAIEAWVRLDAGRSAERALFGLDAAFRAALGRPEGDAGLAYSWQHERVQRELTQLRAA